MFSWIPIYRELAQKLMEYRKRRPELIQILNLPFRTTYTYT